MTNPADTPEVHVDMAVQGIIVDIHRLTDLTRQWPHIVLDHLQAIKMVRDSLALLATHLETQREEHQQVDEPVDFLGAG